MTLHRRIEEAALNAWPALQQELYDGWVLRFSNGYTKRANSVTPLYASDLPLDETIRFCENRYRAADLPPIFRLTSFAAPPEMDSRLELRGYRLIDHTLVEHRDLRTYTPPVARAIELQTLTLDEWLKQFSALRGASPDAHKRHRAILAKIAHPLFAAAVVDGQTVSCALAVLEGRFCGLFDLVTAESARNRGYGSALVTHMLAWAQNQGAHHAYLQVVRDNDPARHLYEKRHGFAEIYHYWYRVPEKD